VSPLWRKAPLALRHHPTVLLAVAAAALLVALAASSSPFVTTAVASEALRNRLEELTPLSTGLKITSPTFRVSQTSYRLVENDPGRTAVHALAKRLPHTETPLFTTEVGSINSPLEISTTQGDQPIRLMSRTGALAHVRVLSQVSGPGVFISNITASTGHIKPGSTFRLDSQAADVKQHFRFRVKGIYRALPQSAVTPYWTNFYEDAWPQGLDATPPPTYVFASPARVLAVGRAFGGGMNIAELPVDPKGITLPEARDLERRFTAVHDSLQTAFGAKLGCLNSFNNTNPCATISSLSSAVALADQNVDAISPVVTLLADIGAVIALGVAAAAGVFLVRRRNAEASLLYARGESVVTFGGRTLVEALLPTVVGGAAGFALALGLTSVFAPRGAIAPDTVWSGAAHAAVAVGIGLVLLVGAAGFSFLRLFDTGTHRLPWLRYLPWELPVLAVALYLFVDLRNGGGLAGDTGARHPTLAVFLFPLLLVAALTGLAVQLVRLPLRSRRVGAESGTVVFLALRRLAAARGLLVVLTVVSAVAFGACFYAEALSNSLSHTTTEKAYIANGSDVQGTIESNQSLPQRFPYPLTRVQYVNQGVYVDNEETPANLMIVDPTTLISTLHWQSDWGANPARLVQQLGAASTSPLPVITTSDAGPVRAIYINDIRFPVRQIGSVRTFPEAAQGVPLVITSAAALSATTAREHLVDVLDVPFTYVWAKGPPQQVAAALSASPLEPYYVTTVDTFLHDPGVVLATRTYGFMRTVAIASAVLVLIGVLLYLQARQRSQVIASALAQRMGLGRGQETLSLCVELAAILGFAALVGGAVAVAAAIPIVHHLDPLPADPPSPIFVFPFETVIAVAAGLVVFTPLAGAVTSWLARRTDVSEAIRVV
jgi:putative ABC transport system permease protein